MINTIKLVVGQCTDRGRVRSRNEDAVGGPPPGLDPRQVEHKGQLHMIADGMGGEAGGQEASQLAIRTLISEYYQDPQPDLTQSLWRAIQSANQAVYQEARRSPERSRMGTTVTAAVIRGEDLVIGQVGDSRAYLIRNGEVRQLTRDHTLVAEAMRSGALSPEEARTHPNRHILTRALGAEPEVTADLFQEKLQWGDRVVLCSDGLSNMVSDEEIMEYAQQPDPAQAAEVLVALANERGSPDNVSVVVLALQSSAPTLRATAPQPSAAGRGRGRGRLALVGVSVVVLAVVVLAAVYGLGLMPMLDAQIGGSQATPGPAGPAAGAPVPSLTAQPDISESPGDPASVPSATLRPTATPRPTDTSRPPTSTPVPSTPTIVLPTDTPVPPTQAQPASEPKKEEKEPTATVAPSTPKPPTPDVPTRLPVATRPPNPTSQR